jgi:hypothetical protein
LISIRLGGPLNKKLDRVFISIECLLGVARKEGRLVRPSGRRKDQGARQ